MLLLREEFPDKSTPLQLHCSFLDTTYLYLQTTGLLIYSVAYCLSSEHKNAMIADADTTLCYVLDFVLSAFMRVCPLNLYNSLWGKSNVNPILEV